MFSIDKIDEIESVISDENFFLSDLWDGIMWAKENQD